jgi:hypothetical protein
MRSTFHLALILVLVGPVLMLAALACSSGRSKHAMMRGLEPTPADVPIRVFADGTRPECRYALIGRISVRDLAADVAADSVEAREAAHRELRKLAREMGGHAVIVDTVQALRGRVVPDPRTIEDIVPEARDDHPLAGTTTDELEERADPRPQPELDPDFTDEVSVGVQLGRSGLRLAGTTEDRLTVSGFVIYFLDEDCGW